VHKYANFISSLTLGTGPIRTQKAIKAKLVRVLCESTNEPDSGEIRRHIRTYAFHISFFLRKRNSKTTWSERNMSVTEENESMYPKKLQLSIVYPNLKNSGIDQF